MYIYVYTYIRIYAYMYTCIYVYLDSLGTCYIGVCIHAVCTVCMAQDKELTLCAEVPHQLAYSTYPSCFHVGKTPGLDCCRSSCVLHEHDAPIPRWLRPW